MIKQQVFGKTQNGDEVIKYTLSAGGVEVDIMNLGGTINAIRVPDKTGKIVDVALGYDDVHGYEVNGGYIGALIGRCGNRIGEGKFTLDGKEYQLALNDGPNHLHGGMKGFDKKIWKATIDVDKLIFETVSPDGEENYPGTLEVKVVYTLSNEGELTLEYFAKSDKNTLCNLTNHCYFNLNGGGTEVYDTYLTLDADYITPVDNGLIPRGKLYAVENTPFDFRKAKKIGKDIYADNEQLKICGGYDHNFCINTNGKFTKYGEAYSEDTGIVMECYTNLPGVQLYTGNFLDGVKGKCGKIYNKRGAFCLETQVYPNAVNCPEYPTSVLKAGETYHTKTSYKFSVKK